MSDGNNTNPKDMLILVDFQVFLYVNLVALLSYFLGVFVILALRRCPRMDPKAWWNMAVNICSFAVKTLAWIIILQNTDPAQLKNIEYANSLWYKEAHWFLFDYFATYVIKMSIYVFIFETRLVWEHLSSES